jgi:hypothetical protein
MDYRTTFTLAHELQWPAWAQAQLNEAIEMGLAFGRESQTTSLAGALYHGWFTPPRVELPAGLLRRPLAGLYRGAHAGSTRRARDTGVQVIERRDAIGRDRWWRTWGDQWSPALSRNRTSRLLLSPDMTALEELITAATTTLLDLDEPWLLACPTLPTRLRHSGSAVIYLPSEGDAAGRLVDALSCYMRADTPPLCLPLAPGIALAEHPGNGMTFGEHRSHLIALALESAPLDPLRAIAEVFGLHGISPAEPHRRSGLG